MKRLNNKGFAISTILFSILLIFVSVLIVTYSVIATNPDKKAGAQCPNGCENTNCVCPEKQEEKCANEFIVGTEHFCVLYQDSTNVVALAKYNLNLGRNKVENEPEGLQSKKTKEFGVGSVASLNLIEISSNQYGYYDMLNIQSNVAKYNQTRLKDINNLHNGMSKPLIDYVNGYKNKLLEIINTNHLGINSSNLKVRLLNIDDISDTNNFSCLDVHGKTILYYNDGVSHDNNTWKCTENYNNRWLFWTNYWTAVAHKGGQNLVYTLSIMGSEISKEASGTTDDSYGVRPVIEISKSEFDNLPKA